LKSQKGQTHQEIVESNHHPHRRAAAAAAVGDGGYISSISSSSIIAIVIVLLLEKICSSLPRANSYHHVKRAVHDVVLVRSNKHGQTATIIPTSSVWGYTFSICSSSSTSSKSGIRHGRAFVFVVFAVFVGMIWVN